MKPLFFETPGHFRQWLSKNHDKKSEQWIGYYKKGSGRSSITWPESVDQALCYGWIDGLRKTIDEESYKIRFTPRKPDSHWSAVNIKRVNELKKLGLMKKQGLDAFGKRKAEKSGRASYEQTNVRFDSKYQSELRNHRPAWEYFQAQTPSYRKQCIWWVMSARKEETRERRLQTLIDSSVRHEVIPPLKWSVKGKKT